MDPFTHMKRPPLWTRVLVLMMLATSSGGVSSRRRSKPSSSTSKASGRARPKGGWPIPVTPGQPSPGDPSYLSDMCRHHVDDARTKYMGHPNRKGDPKEMPGWSKNHPSPSDFEFIESRLREDGNNWCPYLTRECVKPDVVYRQWKRNKRLPSGGTWQTTFFTQEQVDELPSVPQGTFGTCAFVSVADTIITEKGWGPIIDSHDTVMRLGHPPLKGFEQHLGSRADVVLGRGATLGAKLPPGYDPKWTLGCQFKGSNATWTKMWGMKKNYKKSDEKAPGPGLIGMLYKRMVAPMHKPRGATSGIIQGLGVILSGLCTRLDIFGMSPHNGGHYFCNRGSTHSFKSYYTTSSCGKLQYVHSPGIENWLLHYIMKNHPELNTCVYL